MGTITCPTRRSAITLMSASTARKRRRKGDGSGEDPVARSGKATRGATFAKALKKHFDDLDKSGDGDLSKREVKQALQTLAERIK